MAGVFRPPSSVQETPLIIAPTIEPQPSPTAAILREVFRPSATPSCLNNLLYITDLTIPDGSVISPGATIDKRWQVENNGSCNWDERYRLRLVEGPAMEAVTDQMLFPARSGTRAEIRILFKAPSEPGTYRSAWQANDPLSQPFGDIIYIEIQVTTSGYVPSSQEFK